MKLETTLIRRYRCSAYTIGVMYAGNDRVCDMLEDCDRGLTDEMTETQILKKKVYGRTAIPTGRYRIKMTVSPKFKSKSWAKKYGGMVPEIIGVKGFVGARIHPGNRPEDTYGCPHTGENKVKGQVINSVACYYKLMDKYLWPAYLRGEEMWITVK